MIKPSYDLSNLKTNHEIILFVRDEILEKMNLRIRLYPSFVKQANRCKNRDELIVLAHKITKKAAKLAREIGTTKKVKPKEKAKSSAVKKKKYFLKYNEKNDELTLTKRTGYVLSIIENLEDILPVTTNLEDIEPKGEKALSFLELVKSFQKKRPVPGELFFCEQCKKNVSHVKEDQAAYCTECSYLLNWREIQSASKINLDCRQCNKMIEGVLYHLRSPEKDEVTGYLISGNCKQCNLTTEIRKTVQPKRSHEKQKPALENKSLRGFSKVKDSESTITTKEREGIPITSTIIVQKNGYPKKEEKNNLDPPLSVWNHIQAYLKYPDEKKDDPGFFKRLENYSKRALVIINVIDTYQVFCVGEAWRKANEITGVNIRSQTTIGDLLNDLAGDGFLDLEILETNRKIETSLYSIKGYKEKFPERYNIKKLRHSNDTTKKRLSKKMDIQEIEQKATKISMAQKKGYAKAREIEQEKLETTKEQEIKEHQANRYTPESRTNKPIIGELTQDQVMAQSYSKMTASQVKIYSEKNPVFKAEYKRLKKEGLI